MSNKVIIYYGGFELPDKNAAALRVVANAKILKENGFKVILIGTEKRKSGGLIKLKNKHFEMYTTKYPETLIDWILYQTSIRSIKKLLNSYNNLDSIILYDAPSPILFKMKLFSIKNSLKVYGDCTEWYDPSGKKSFLRRYFKRVDTYIRMRILHKTLDGLIVISKYLFNYYSKSNIKCMLVPPLVDKNEKKWKIQIEPNDNDKTSIIYAGSPFSKSENSNAKDRLDNIIEILADVVKEKEKFEFNIIGITKKDFVDFYPECKSALNKLGEHINFKGRIPHKEVIKEVKQNDFFFFIRDNTRVSKAGFPTKFVEAISCGIPVLTNKTSDLENYLIEGKNGYWVDPENLHKSLLACLTIKKEKIQKMKKFCSSYDRFHIDNYTNDFNKFFIS